MYGFACNLLDGYLDIVKQVIEHGVDVNCNDENGKTSLLYACKYGC
jgi:ankyrin repeat protein